jgi:hypothetical protein
MSETMGLRSGFRALADRIVAAHRRRQTARILESLPPSILKDIGLSGDYADMTSRRW